MIDPNPLPPELAEPDAGGDAWVAELMAAAVELADDAGVDPDVAGRNLADGQLMPNEAPEPFMRWTVTDDSRAEWALRHVARAQGELEQLRTQADEWEARIHAWFMHRAKPLLATVAFMEAHLERYAIELRQADEKRKTLTLPSGHVRTTATKPKVIVADERIAMEWAEVNAPDAIARDPRLRVGRLREHVVARELATLAWVTNSCGCKVSVRDDEGLDIPPVGTGIECSTCGADALIGLVEVLATRMLALTPGGAVVPGVDVDRGGITAKVVLG